jgi:hypothetical protein
MADPGKADPGIGTFVRYWLHYSNLASSFFKQYGAAKQIRDDYEKQIIAVLENKRMEKATIQINNGQIRMIEKKDTHPLTLSKIEELLHSYFKFKSAKDDTLEIMIFIRANRGFSVNKILKQSTLEQKKLQ